MTKKIDYIKKEITKQLKPRLIEKCFYRTYPKVFERVRGDIIDTIEFQMSQYGSQLFYIHYYCSLLPVEKSYRRHEIRYRDSRNDNDDIDWIGDNEENARKAILSLLNALEEKILPWFDSIKSIEYFMVEDYLLNAYAYDKDISNFYGDWVFKLLGKDKVDFIEKGKLINILNINKEKEENQPLLRIREDKTDEKREALYKLFKETKNVGVDEIWLEGLREETIKASNLEKVINKI